MNEISYKDGYCITIRYNNDFSDFFVLIGSEDRVRTKWNSPDYHWFKLNWKYYIEYVTEIYSWKDEEGFVLLDKYYFDVENQNVLFKLFPRNNEEISTWLNYLKEFEIEKKCKNFYYIENKENLIIPDDINIVDLNFDNYYSSYKICWDDDININPLGNNFSGYELINNLLLRK